MWSLIGSCKIKQQNIINYNIILSRFKNIAQFDNIKIEHKNFILTRKPSPEVAQTALAYRTRQTENACRCYSFTVSNSGLLWRPAVACLHGRNVFPSVKFYPPFLVNFDLWPWHDCTQELDTDTVNVNQARFPRQMSFRWNTHTAYRRQYTAATAVGWKCFPASAPGLVGRQNES